MKFLDKCEELEEKEDKFIVLVRKGIFFTAIGKSAIELSNKSLIKVIGYNEIADYMYKKLDKDKRVFIRGKILEEGEVFIKIIEIKRYRKICIKLKFTKLRIHDIIT